MRTPSSSAASSSSSASNRHRHVSSDRLLRLLALALVLLVSGSLLLSSMRLRCQSAPLSPPSSSPMTHTGLRASAPIELSSSPLSPSQPCSPTLVDPRKLLYRPPHKFTDLLLALHPLFPPPSFPRKHHHLCDADPLDREWSFCLPITGRHDLPYCAAADRIDLLSPQSPHTLCYASVLHLLLVDVYAELQAHDARPALLFGSMLGAVRNASLIAFTEDADLGFVNTRELRMRRVKAALWQKGYHLFRQGVLRVCVAPTHPLAGNLYDPRRDSLHHARHVPYVDLYRMQLAPNRLEWEIEETQKDRRVPRAKFEPYTNATINGMAFNTLADPQDFLRHEYGPRWRTPLRRGAYRVVDGSGSHEPGDLPEGARPPSRPFGRGDYDLADGDYDSAVDYEYDMPEIGDDEASYWREKERDGRGENAVEDVD